MPEQVVAKLDKLKDQEFDNYDAFVAELKNLLDPDEFARFHYADPEVHGHEEVPGSGGHPGANGASRRRDRSEPLQ